MVIHLTINILRLDVALALDKNFNDVLVEKIKS